MLEASSLLVKLKLDEDEELLLQLSLDSFFFLEVDLRVESFSTFLVGFVHSSLDFDLLRDLIVSFSLGSSDSFVSFSTLTGSLLSSGVIGQWSTDASLAGLMTVSALDSKVGFSECESSEANFSSFLQV